MEDKHTKKLKKLICDILEDCSTKIKNNDDYLLVEDIISDMVYKIKDNIPFSGIDGEKILVRDVVNNIIKYNDRFSDYPINNDRMNWITREFHDNQFDYDEFEKGVITSMEYVKENYEE